MLLPNPGFIFILGCQRSGTTLLKSMFGAHPDIHAIDHDIWFRSNTDKSLEAFKKHCYEESKGSRTLCVKGPQLVWHTEWIKKEFPASSIIWIFRDPAEVVSSMLQLEVTGFPWLDCFEKSEGKRHDVELTGSRVEKCIAIWRMKNKLVRGIPVSYEYLCALPEKTLKKLCKNTGLQYHPRMLKHHTLPDTSGKVGEFDNSRPVEVNGKDIDKDLISEVTAATEGQYEDLLRWFFEMNGVAVS